MPTISKLQRAAGVGGVCHYCHRPVQIGETYWRIATLAWAQFTEALKLPGEPRTIQHDGETLDLSKLSNHEKRRLDAIIRRDRVPITRIHEACWNEAK